MQSTVDPVNDAVDTALPAPLLPHERSSVRRLTSRRSADRTTALRQVGSRRLSPTAAAIRWVGRWAIALLALPSTFALTAQGQRVSGAVSTVVKSIDSAAVDTTVQPNISPVGERIAGLRLRGAGDTLVFRGLSRFGILTNGFPYRPDSRWVARQLVARTRQRIAVNDTAQWTRVVQRDLLAQSQRAADLAAAADSASRVPRPGSLIPLTSNPASAPRVGADAGKQIGGADFLAAVSDLGIVLDTRLESKLLRTRNLRCTSAQLSIIGSNCEGSWQPSFDFQFNLRTGGVIAERVHMNVDYDSQREFDASNNISVYYQGKTDEILQRLEVGNVTLQIPASRFLTSGIPSGNYGVQASGQLGPMRFTSIAAQQKGNVSKDNIYTVGDRTQQRVDRAIEDIQIEQRRFFFTIDPRQLRGFPNIDLLNRQQMQQLAASLPDSIRPTRIFLYRQLVGASNQNPRGPQFSVRGARNPTRQVYQVLRENIDYYVDPSQLWIALISPLDPQRERLAVAYEVGGVGGRNINTGGTPDIELTDAPQFANLLWEPELQPSAIEYFQREIKSVYRSAQCLAFRPY